MSDPLARYYAERAPEYDRVYEKPERQADLGELSEVVAAWAEERSVLELACGTGWWTQVMARTARSIVATDVNEEVLAIARTRVDPGGVVELRTADAFHPGDVSGDFDGLFAGFWLSHLRRDQVADFVAAASDRVGTGGSVFLVDNRYVKGSSTPIARHDREGNSYQRRALEAGEEYEVLKNFFEREELSRWIDPHASTREIRLWPHYWVASWEVS